MTQKIIVSGGVAERVLGWRATTALTDTLASAWRWQQKASEKN